MNDLAVVLTKHDTNLGAASGIRTPALVIASQMGGIANGFDVVVS